MTFFLMSAFITGIPSSRNAAVSRTAIKDLHYLVFDNDNKTASLLSSNSVKSVSG